MQNSWLVLLPLFIVLPCAFITGNLNMSLVIGIVAASLIATDFSLTQTPGLMLERFKDLLTDPDTIYMYSFLALIGIIVVFLSQTGGAGAFVRIFTKKLRSKKMAESASFFLSSTLFIDDYLINLTVVYVMRPLTDKFKIPRTKLAFLVHSMSGPLVILAPISSWVAMITSQLDQAGVSPQAGAQVKILADPFYIYLRTIPFIFYSFLLIASVWFIIRQRTSYGPMHTHERIAAEKDNLFGGKKPLKNELENDGSQTGSLTDLLIPLGTLLGCVLIGIPWAGGYYLFGGEHSLLDAFKHNTQTSLVLFVSAVTALIVGILFAIARKKITMQALPSVLVRGTLLMSGAIIMVALASTLGGILRQDLQAGQYLAGILLNSISITLLPLMFFIVATITATVTGSSWGTIALLTPIAIPMLTSFAQVTLPAAPEAISILFPVLGAIFSGAVCGDHISPISETTIMASTSSGCYPLDHAHTQFPYAAPALVCSAATFLLSGCLATYSIGFNIAVSLSFGIASCLTTIYLLNKWYKG